MSEKKYNRQAFGESGGQYMTAGTAYTNGPWHALKILSDCTFSTLTSNITGLPNTLVKTAPDTIPGTFTAITLGTGALIAYSQD